MTRPAVLYIVYWGAAEPLGRSLVVPSVARMARVGVDLTVVTYEKPGDWKDELRIAEVRETLTEAGATWVPLKYHKRPKLPATLFDLCHGLVVARRRHRRRPFEVIHARTFAAGLIGLPLARLTRAKLVYHNEGFYPDEQVDGGVWRAGSAAHRIARGLERRIYSAADATIVMSHHSRDSVAALPEVSARDAPVFVVPSCVDLERFGAPRPQPAAAADAPLRLVYVGSVGTRYRLDAVSRFAALASRRLGQVELRVCTHQDEQAVAETLQAGGLSPEAYSIAPVAYDDIPGELARHDVGLLFQTPGPSTRAGSPTKVGEYWAAGLPVVCSAEAGDLDSIIRSELVGVVVEGESDEDLEAALEGLLRLRRDPALTGRCRAAAEQHYGLEPACERQLELYAQILREPGQGT